MAAFGIFALLVLALFVALIALLVWAVRRPTSGRADEGGPGSAPGAGAHSVRRFFQYTLMYAMTVLAAVGFSNLLTRALTSSNSPTDESSQEWEARLLAEDVSFALVGSLVLATLVWWTWRTLRRDPREASSLGLVLAVTATALTSLITTIVHLQAFIAALVRPNGDPGTQAAPALVWGLVWVATWFIAARALPPTRQLPHRTLGSTVGLVTMTWGFTTLLSTSLQILITGDTLVGGRTALASAGAVLLVGALVWIRYWILAAQSDPHSTWWHLHVLVVGVAGGLLLALTGASLTLWDVLVWLVGDPGTRGAASHFSGTPGHVAAALAGVVVWWYHRAAVAGSGEDARSEVRRVYEYLVAGVALAASAAGTGMLVVALIASLTPGDDVGMSVRNTLLSALTLLAVGVPVWVVFWRRIQRAMAADPIDEGASPTRRIALVLVLGLSTVTAVIALIAVVMTLAQDLLAGDFSAATLHSARYGLGVLVAATAVAGYHAAVWREDRVAVTRARTDVGAQTVTTGAPGSSGVDADITITQEEALADGAALPQVPRPVSIILVGNVPDGLGQELARRTGASVEVWLHPDAAQWDLEQIIAELTAHPGQDLLVIGEDADLRVLEVERKS
ncbi:DUF5671 domain-containing protein [Actinomyces provencensis]|uniref:DUF5671 domain-containing protein n=1 Tax=Actinomyces provencensis TaxID=1720198 RepID=UPI00096A82C6|nr:DUF5671 domain-containing protein [Actinomyces provencensis]